MIWFARRIAELQIALMLLTRLPAGNLGSYIPELKQARWAFPLVGLPIGIALAGVYFTLSHVSLAPLLASLIALGFALRLTGAMHEDGLADCADGFGGGIDRDRKLEIMKDSHIGSYGVLALIIVMGARITSLSLLPLTSASFIIIISCAMLSRLVMVALLSFMSSARSDGLGHSASSQSKTPLFIALVLCLPACYYGVLLAPLAIIALFGTAAVIAYLAKKQIGGQTGDVCGAAQITSETAGWIAASMMLTIEVTI